MFKSSAQVISARLSQPQAPKDPQVHLRVGERCFITTAATLTQESEFFSSLLSGRWNPPSKEEREMENYEEHFIDADPDLFEHLLRYLRRGVLPVFYDRYKGHDDALYLALLEEARYFQIRRLERWLSEKRYVVSGNRQTDAEFEYHPFIRTTKVYVCPRGITVHRGDPWRCGRQCHNALGDGKAVYEDEKRLFLLEIQKRTVFDPQICLEGR